MTDSCTPIGDMETSSTPAAERGHSTAAIYKAIIETVELLKCSGTVIDFGAGDGYMTGILCGNGAFQNVIALDRESGSFAHERSKWITADLNCPLPIENSRADLLIAVEVIEHLENPWAVAREWHRVLKPGGRLIMSTPNNECWTAILHMIFKGHFHLFLEPWYPGHMTALLKMDITRILDSAGFEKTEFAYTNEGMLPKWVSSTWQNLSAGLLRGRRYSDNIICYAQKPLTRGNSK